jgi:hypothetical protein
MRERNRSWWTGVVNKARGKRTWGMKYANGIFGSENGNYSRTAKEKE